MFTYVQANKLVIVFQISSFLLHNAPLISSKLKAENGVIVASSLVTTQVNLFKFVYFVRNTMVFFPIK